jgi:hypothetical protein
MMRYEGNIRAPGDTKMHIKDNDGTVEQFGMKKIRKQHKEYMDHICMHQYKTGRLDPEPGEQSPARMQISTKENLKKQADMTEDPKID